MKRWAMCIGTVLTVVLAGCAGGAAGGGGEASDTMREDLGRQFADPLNEARNKIWQRYQIPLYRQEQSYQSILWESEWVRWDPSQEARTEGLTASRYRVYLRGQNVGTDLEGRREFRTTLEVEHQGRTEAMPEWHPVPIPDGLEERLRRMVSDMEMEIRAGVRR